MKYLKKFIIPVLLVFTAGLAFVIFANYQVNSISESEIYTNLEDVPGTKIAIVFGAGIDGNKPGKYLKDRLDAGILLYKQNKVEKLLLSGDNGSDAHDELSVMKLYCFENGVDTNKIYVDYAGFDSYSTVYRAKHIFKIDTAILVTQKYHLNRCIYLGNKLGLKSFGFTADQGIYPNYKYHTLREKIGATKVVLDLLVHRKPKYLGAPIDMDGKSNYAKE
ncbi:MAG: hypothetical protein EOO93_13015 [Pedobacter sp.]|nr:MAG: hypothetical protein EOO93_13015 [Pedobacter sp.]